MKTEKSGMKKYFSLFTLLFSLAISAQTSLSTSENYIYTKNCLDGDCTKKSESVQYFDGLGRPIQSVAIKATPLGKDVVVPIEYDSKGRQAKSYLPVPQPGTASGAIYTDPLANAASAGYGSEKIYSEKRYDDLFTTRVNQVAPVGTAWSQKPSNMAYGTNAANEVKKYEITTSWVEGRTNSKIDLPGTFAANQLMKTSVTDPDGNTGTEFKNSKGQTILVRKNDGTQNVDTYYLYNEYGQLVYVIPPLAVETSAPNQTMLDKLCYQYRYDGLGRLVEKKVPGKGWEYMVYDKADKLLLTQDAVMATQNKWLMTKYDMLGRIAYTGIVNNNSSRSILQNQIADLVIYDARNSSGFVRNGITVYYTSVYLNIDTLLSVNYYDTYPAYSFNPAFPSSILGEPVITDTQNASVNTQAMPTLSLVKNIEDDNWTKNYVYYDKKGRATGTYSINHLGGYTRTESELDFSGMAKQTKVYHKRQNIDVEKVITQSFDYDSQNRVLKHRHQINSGPVELLTENTYNELSQLSNKKVGNGLQSIDYQYDIRGALTKINDPNALGTKLFGYEMKYFNPQNTTQSSTGKYNGNITEVTWKTASDQVLKQYNYQYDALNRLKKGTYSEPGASVPENGFFNETLAYDLNGNITSLQRNGKSFSAAAQLIDNLSYNYTGNKLNTITDTSGNYSGYPDSSGNTISYDDNGNMKDHIDKGVLKIDYNFLNLPDYVEFDKLYASREYANLLFNVNTKYVYKADGTKLQKTYTFGSGKTNMETITVTDYLDGFQYEAKYTGTKTAPVLKFVPTAEGYYNFENNKYIYTYTDHLGNNRLSYTQNSTGTGTEIIEENGYYPFGLRHNASTATTTNPAYNYQYNGKELQKETGWNDYGARMYMADIGRWGVIDPLAEQMRRFSPYNYAFNNPVSFVDPDGMKPMNMLKIAGDGFENTDVSYGGSNPNWVGLGNAGSYGESYGFGSVSSGGGGSIYQTDQGTVYTGSAASDAFSSLLAGNTKPPKPNFWKRAGNWIRNLFGESNKGAGIATIVPGATATKSRTGKLEVGDVLETESFISSYGDGFIDGAESTWSYVKGQVFGDSYWDGVANTFSLGAYNTLKTIDGLVKFANDAPEYTTNDYAYGAGFITEKAAEAIILKKVSQVNPFGINGGYGFKIGRTEFLYANPSVGGGTIFSYASSSGGKFRIDYHGLPSINRGNTLHFHSNYWGFSNSPHRSLNPFNFGKPIK
ncbi:DUF6443 domain-containing protein [Chryseobacterium angstadtii]|uniref:DUF6443 domain-containing protein n=1 Tax=Chryseobacterium angstadtii TaxID=558151 RepID=UPI0012FE9058|nr:DUF6443 domain-containing protein [Chryseobacterium angstadtii]